MSLDARLKQGFANLADPIDVDYELGLVRVQAVARQRERRNVMIAAFAGAAAAIALLALGGRVADLVLGIEVPLPTVVDPNLEDDRGIDESRFDRDNPENDLRIDEALDEQTEAGTIDTASGGLLSGGGGFADNASASQQKGRESSNDSDTEDDDSQPVAPTTRTDEGRYTGAAVHVAGGTSSCEQAAGGAACVRLETEPGERSVEISIVDDGGGPVYAAVQIDRDADGSSDGEWSYFCTETVRPVAIPSDGVAVVYVEIYRGTCQDGSGAQSNPVGGTVTAVFAS